MCRISYRKILLKGEKMETQSTHRLVSQGQCTFCKAEITKNKMTQHLKSCKQRLATNSTREEKSRKTEQRLFHIMAEGKYSPEYWLHFEVPASATLQTVDQFLKSMWIEDLDHLSGFTINDTNYGNDYPDDFLFLEEEVAPEEDAEELSEEEEKAEVERLINEATSTAEKILINRSGNSLASDSLLTAWIAEVKKPRPADELVDFLKGEQASIIKNGKSPLRRDKNSPLEERRKQYLVWEAQKMVIEDLLMAFEDTSIDVVLGRILSVGQKFSYIYDYGSSTYINLKVVAEREGIVQNKKKPVQLLARNNTPVYPCAVCGKPATTIATYYDEDDTDGNVFCTKCAKTHVEEDDAMPLINSPRVGVL
jgi:hypothetical protein